MNQCYAGMWNESDWFRIGPYDGLLFFFFGYLTTLSVSRLCIHVCMVHGGMRIIWGKPKNSDKTTPLLHVPPQIPHYVTRDETRAAGVGNQRLLSCLRYCMTWSLTMLLRGLLGEWRAPRCASAVVRLHWVAECCLGRSCRSPLRFSLLLPPSLCCYEVPCLECKGSVFGRQ
jgi:hypothetical protein